MVVIEASDGGRPGLAALEATDGEAMLGLIDRLSPESVYRRYFTPVARREALKAAVGRIDHRDREAIAAVERGKVVGVVEFARAPGSRVADMAIVVADAWQKQGLGTRLVAAAAARAVAAGIEEFAVDIQGDNVGALRLFKRVAPGVRMTFSAGVGEAVIPL
jgi:ribosomal protein S18 acetylase RimI-like enzyme